MGQSVSQLSQARSHTSIESSVEYRLLKLDLGICQRRGLCVVYVNLYILKHVHTVLQSCVYFSSIAESTYCTHFYRTFGRLTDSCLPILRPFFVNFSDLILFILPVYRLGLGFFVPTILLYLLLVLYTVLFVNRYVTILPVQRSKYGTCVI